MSTRVKGNCEWPRDRGGSRVGTFDILVPAALGGVIDANVARVIKASLVAEGANDPCTQEGNAVLSDRGIQVIPDILCNAGAVSVSYFEWVQNLQQYRWSEERVNVELTRILEVAFQRVLEKAKRRHVSLRTHCPDVGVEARRRGGSLSDGMTETC